MSRRLRIRRDRCVECEIGISGQSQRCKSCAEMNRWRNPHDPRRRMLIARNRIGHRGPRLYENRAWFIEQYEVLGQSFRDIAKKFCIALRTVARWAHIHGMAIRRGPWEYLSGSRSPHWRGGLVRRKMTCQKCGGTKAFTAKTCRKCQDKAGGKNPNWRGTADIRILIRQWCHDYWRPAVFARDGHRCSLCGDDRGGNLNAHHRVKLSRLIVEILAERGVDIHSMNPENRAKIAGELCLDPRIQAIDNGVTICEECHRKTHERMA